MANEKFEWLENAWYGGIADDRHSGIAASFADGKGLEIRKNPKSLKLAFASDKQSGSVVTDLPLAFVTIKSTGDVIAFGDTGKIYRNATGAGTWVNVYTDSSSRKIMDAFEFNSFLYWCTPTHLHRIPIANIDASWVITTDVTEDYKAFTNDNTNSHPMTEHNNNLYIGDGNLLAELDSALVFTANKLTIFGDEEIRALTISGSSLNIYSRKSNLTNFGAQYLWDGISSAYNNRWLWRQMIHAAINNGGYDYVLAGKRPVIYYVVGGQRVKLKVIPGVSAAQSCVIHHNAIDMQEDLLCFGPAESGTNSVGRGVWTWGALLKEYPQVLNFDYPNSNDNATDTVGAVHESNGVLYHSWKQSTNYGIDYVNTAKYRATGQITSRVQRGQRITDQKHITDGYMGFEELDTGEAINVYLRSDKDDSFTTAEMTVTAAANPTTNELNQGAPFTVSDWNLLQYQVILTAGTSQLTSPELLEVGFQYEKVNDAK